MGRTVFLGNELRIVMKSAAITPLTDNGGGTADDTLAALTGSYVQATMQNNQADMTAKINAIIAALKAAGITL